MCGFLALPAHEHEPLAPEVEAFLLRGPAPVFMGFGSLMPMGGSDHLTEAIAIFTDAARQSGQRAIIQADVERSIHGRCGVREADAARTGISALRRRGASRRRGDHAQHVARGCAVDHGAARIAISLRGRRICSGLASPPAPLRRTKWSANALAARIREVVGNPQMKAAALEIQRRMAPDNGPATAADMIERAMR